MPTRLGQNFLKNDKIVEQIIKSANLSADDMILEVGPGKGILTEELAKNCKKVVAVEIDGELVSRLRKKFKSSERVEIIEGDILKIDLRSQISDPEVSNYKVIANIPYYITSPIIKYFLENKFPPKEMILMVQKEVAERIVAEPGNHSILSLSVQHYASPELLFYVEKDNFDPAPEVDSAVIKISNIKKQKNKIEPNNFFRVVRAGFCAKRKTLVNNLANSFHLDKKEVEEKLKKIGIESNSRAQELDIETWEKIALLDL